MRIDYMREFLAATDEGSISLAAAKMHVAQPVLSKHIRAIEDTLHVQLFLRSPKGLTLTPRGQQVYALFKEVIEKYDSLVGELNASVNDFCGTLHLGILSMGFEKYIAPLVERFNAQYPNVAVSYTADNPKNIIDAVLDGTLDLGFLGQSHFSDDGALSYRCIDRDILRAVVRRDSEIAKRGVVAPEDVVDKTLVCLRVKETSEVLNDLVMSAGFKPKDIRETDELEIVASTIATLDGFFIVPDFMRGRFELSEIVTVVDFSVPLSLPVFFVYKTASHRRLTSLFLDTLPLDPA